MLNINIGLYHWLDS